MTTFLRSSVARQKGVTLTELMIALVLGALVVLAATAMVVTSRGTYRNQDETTRLAESARFGLELSNRLVRLAGYTNFGDDLPPPASYTTDPTWALSPNSYAFNGPDVVGTNNSKPTAGAAINGSDSLTIRFFGSSPIGSVLPDGNVLDCAGTPVPQAPPSTTAIVNGVQGAQGVNNIARSYNVLYVDLDTDGEPALMCQRQVYDGVTGLPTGVAAAGQALIRGVEDFQVLYGELIAQPSPNADLDENAPASIVYRSGIGGPNPVVNWGNVRSVRIAMLLRSATGARPDAEATTNTYSLFGTNYPGSTDTGAIFSLSGLSQAERTRVRRVVETTVFIRNRVTDWPSLYVN
jgi:type IV pilus assembly protein PilW